MEFRPVLFLSDRDRADRGALEAALAVPAIDFTADQRADELADHAASRSPVARSQAAPNPRSTSQPIAQVATTGTATLRTFAATAPVIAPSTAPSFPLMPSIAAPTMAPMVVAPMQCSLRLVSGGQFKIGRAHV